MPGRGVCIPAALFAILLFAHSAPGQLPYPRLQSVIPPGGQAGSQIDVKLQGADLDGVDRLLFTHEGITARPKTLPPDDFHPDPRPVEGELTVEIAPDVPPGLYEVRAVGHFGASNPRRFQVDAVPNVTETGDNTSPEKAMSLEVGTTASGRVDAERVDYYRFAAQAGAPLVIECFARRIDSRLDATLTLFNPEGRQIDRARAGLDRDPVLAFTALAPGEYTVAVSDFLYRGGSDCFYRLSLHRGPAPEEAAPPPGEPDAADRLAMVGVPMSDLPGVAEQEPNDTPEQAAMLDVPCEYAGGFQTRGDRDWVAFSAAKGDVLSIEVFSRRLGTPCDPVLRVEKVTKTPQGEDRVSQVAQVDNPITPRAGSNLPPQFDLSSDDPQYRLAADEDATYRVEVRDLYGPARPGSDTFYRLAVRPAESDFSLVAFTLPPDQRDRNRVAVSSPVLRRGGTVALLVRMLFRGGFEGDVELSVEGLPPGVTSAGATIGGRVDWANLVLTADGDAAPWVGPIEIVGRATVDGREIRRTARPAAVVSDGTASAEDAWLVRPTQSLPLAVIAGEPPPVRIALGDGPVLETTVGGKLEVPIRLQRSEGFTESVTPVLDWLPREIGVKAGKIDGDEGKLELNLGNKNIPPGTYTFCLRGQTKEKRVRNPEAVAAAEAEQKRLEQIIQEETENVGKLKESGATQEALAEAEARLKRAGEAEAGADKQLTDVQNANKERDFNVELISTPLRVRVRPKE